MSRVEILQTTFSKNAFLGVSARLSNPLDDALYSPVRVTQKSEPVRKKLPGVNKSGGSGQEKAPAVRRGSPFADGEIRRTQRVLTQPLLAFDHSYW